MNKVKTKIRIEDNIFDSQIDEVKEYSFDNVFKLKDNEWTTVMSGEQLAMMWLNRDILFHEDCQRGIKLEKNKNGELVKKAVCSAKNIREIKNALVSGDYSPDEMTLNLLDDESSVEFKDHKLKCKGRLFVTDGQHRIKSLADLYSSNMVLKEEVVNLSDRFFNVKITNYDLDKSAEVFSQFTKGLKISKSLSESYNKKNAINRIVGELNKKGALKGKIDTVKTSISKSDLMHLTTFATLSNAIRDSYGEMVDSDMEKTVLFFLQAFFKELTTIFPELINDEKRMLSKEYTLICENFMMYSWIELSQLLYCKRNHGTWKKELKNIAKVNFNKLTEEGALNPTWSTILRLTTNDMPSIINNTSTRQSARRIIKEEFYSVQQPTK